MDVDTEGAASSDTVTTPQRVDSVAILAAGSPEDISHYYDNDYLEYDLL